MLESSGFDFRNRYPQRLVLKIAKAYHVDKETVGKTAYSMSLDLYRTFAPLKQTTPTMAIACVELSARIFEKNILELEAGKGYKKWRITRPEVMGLFTRLHEIRMNIINPDLPETLLDLLDLYTHHRASTVVGQDHVLETFINIRIILNQEASAQKYPRYTESITKKSLSNSAKPAANGTSKDLRRFQPSPRDESVKDVSTPQSLGPSAANGMTTSQSKPGVREGTIRFMLDPERARNEKVAVGEFFKVEEEDYEEEVERGRR